MWRGIIIERSGIPAIPGIPPIPGVPASAPAGGPRLGPRPYSCAIDGWSPGGSCCGSARFCPASCIRLCCSACMFMRSACGEAKRRRLVHGRHTVVSSPSNASSGWKSFASLQYRDCEPSGAVIVTRFVSAQVRSTELAKHFSQWKIELLRSTEHSAGTVTCPPTIVEPACTFEHAKHRREEQRPLTSWPHAGFGLRLPRIFAGGEKGRARVAQS